MNKNHPHLNVLSIWEAIPTDEFYSKQYNAKRTYLQPSGVVSEASIEKPIYAYAKNYTKGKKDFSLFMYSDSSNSKAVEKFFDASVKNVKTTDVSEALVIASTNGFKYTAMLFKGDK